MKAVKIALISLAALVVLLVLAVAVLFLPGVQRAVVTRVVATEPGESLEVAHFHVGLNRTELRDLHFTQSDASYRVGELTADLSVFDLLFRGEARLGDVVATGVTIDVSEMEPTEEPEPFDGILRQMELPAELYLDSLRVEGRMLVAGVGEGPIGGDFLITGGGFAPGEEGTLQLVSDVRAPGVEVFARLGLEGNLTVLQADAGKIERAHLVAQISAPGEDPAPEGGETLNADVLLLATDDGESYQARFQRVMAEETAQLEPAEEPDLSTLIVLDATYLYDEGLLEGRWEVDFDHEQLAAFVGDTELPAFSASGDGLFSYGVTGEVFDVDGRLDLAVTDLGMIAEELRELGGFTMNSRFNVAMDESIFRLEELVVELRDQDDRNLLEARNFQAIRYDRQNERLEGLEERLDLAEVTIHALPLEWANILLAAGEEESELDLSGGDLSGQLVVSTEAGGLFFNLSEPLRAGEISVVSGGEALLSDISFEAGGSGSFQEGRLAANIDPLRFRAGDQDFLTVSGEYDSAANRVQATLDSNLPVLMAQPVLSEYRNLESGRLNLELALDLGQPIELEVNGAARELVTLDEQENLPEVVVQATVREAGDAWELDVPVQVGGTEATDVRLAGEVSAAGEVNRFDLRLSGEQVVVDQLTALGSIVATPEETGEPSPDERDEEPFWTGWEGEITVEIAEVQLQEDYQLEEVQGGLNVEADSVTHGLRATFLESPVELDLRLQFLAEEPRPYVLDGSLEAPELVAGDLFRQLQPDRPPTVEGLFAASVDIRGTGQNLPDLINRVQGEARLRSGGGILRLLYTENPLAGLGIAAGALLGAVSDEVGAISRIASNLSNVPYDEMNILAERDEEFNFILRDFTVVSPELHLQGVGEIRHRDGVEVLEQPLQIELRLGARGSLEESLAAVRALGDETDELGYRQMRREFTIGGTLADPDSTPFYRLLVDTVLRFVRPEGDEDETEERGIIPEIPEVFDLLQGWRGR